MSRSAGKWIAACPIQMLIEIASLPFGKGKEILKSENKGKEVFWKGDLIKKSAIEKNGKIWKWKWLAKAARD